MLSAKQFFKISSVIFFLVALCHGLRLLSGWEVNLGGWNAPTWVSVVGLFVAGYLSYNAFSLSNKK